MTLSSNAEVGPHRTVFRARNTLQSTKEAAGKQSSVEVHSPPRDVQRHPDEITHISLNHDSIHDVGWKDKRKENTGYRGLANKRIYAEHKAQWTKYHSSFGHSGRPSGRSQKFVPVATQKFRIVRDNRNSRADFSIKRDSAQNSDIDKNSVELEASPRSIEGQFNSSQDHCSLELNTVDRQSIPELKLTASSSSIKTSGGTESNNEVHSSVLASTTMAMGMYSSTSDPVHVPSLDSRSDGSLGTTRRQVGVVGSQRQTYLHPSIKTSALNEQISIHFQRKDLSSSTESFEHKIAAPKISSFHAIPASEPIVSVGRGFVANRPSSSSRSNQQVLSRQKVLSNKEWRPKSSQKSRVRSLHSNSAANFSGSIEVEGANLSEKLSQTSIFDGGKVIIPEHLRVPEADQIHLKFGSFGDGFDSSITCHAYDNGHESSDKSYMRISMPVLMSLEKNNSAVTEMDLVNNNLSNPQSDALPSTENKQALIAHCESLSPKNILSYEDIDTVQCEDPSSSFEEPHKPENSSSLHRFWGFGQASDFAPFPKVAIVENAQQNLPLASEPHSPASQLHSRADNSQFTNFVPYQHIMAPIHIPPMAMPVYSANHAYLPSPNGSNCPLIPGGNPNLASGSLNLKYNEQQYRTVHAGSPVGYPSYVRPSGYAIGNSGVVVSAANADDLRGFKYMDNGLFIPNPQAPRELAAMHPSSFGLFGQGAMQNAAYQQSHPDRSFHGGAHSTFLQYPSGSYHPSISGSLTCPQQLIHQVPLHGSGTVVVAPGAPTATYQQPQLSHVGWTANF